MHYLSDVRLYGFTVFGFWLPLVLWSGYVIFFARNIRSFWKDAFIMSVAGVLLTSFVVRGGIFGLNDLVGISAIPIFYLFFRKQAGYWQIAGTTYIASIVSDLAGCSVVSGMHTGWLPYMLFTQPYSMQMTYLQGIGGAGLLDGLVLEPVCAALLVFIIRQAVGEYLGKKMVAQYNITGQKVCDDL